MAVQAQYPSNVFAADFRGAKLPRTSNVAVAEEMQMQMQMQMQVLQEHRNSLLASYSPINNNNNNIGAGAATVFSSPQSELTCNNINLNACASRKRAREQQQQLLASFANATYPPVTASAKVMPMVDANVMNRRVDSALTSTSGRPATPSSSLANDLISHLHQQNLEIDALVRLQNERLRSVLEEARKRQCRALAFAVEQGVARRLREKEAELESACRRNAELEEKVRQMSAESQAWFNLAKSNESIAAGLRATLEHLLLQATNNCDTAEGFGDSDSNNNNNNNNNAVVADDAQSCCYEGEAKQLKPSRWVCKTCGDNDVCVLLLPCRHLCLCKACESKVDTCPICFSSKNASLHISMS